jgi:hypothetical protein
MHRYHRELNYFCNPMVTIYTVLKLKGRAIL